MNTTAVNYAHTIARMTGIDVAALDGLDVMDLDVLYFGVLSDESPVSFRSTVNYLETAALEIYVDRVFDPADHAYCRLVLARRANAARR